MCAAVVSLAFQVCFDGKSRQEVKRGDGIMIKMSQYPMPSINYGDQMSEFVGSLVRCLNWNDREVRTPPP
jgi:NAD+ kinase